MAQRKIVGAKMDSWEILAYLKSLIGLQAYKNLPPFFKLSDGICEKYTNDQIQT